MKLGQLLAGIESLDLNGGITEEISAVCYSADQCREGSLFVAITGLKHDGHDFIGEAVSRGAKCIIHEKDIKLPHTLTAVKVASSRRALGILSKNYFRNPSGQLVLMAITGTSGKTTITYLLESILKVAGFKCGVLGTVNYRFNDKIEPAPNTTPESYELQKILRTMSDEGITHVAAEVSSHAVDLRRIDDCDFDLGIFTNLSPEHLDYHETMESYYQAKKRFFAEVLPQSSKEHTRKMVINADDEWGRRILEEVNIPALTYGLDKACDIKAQNYEFSLSGIRATIDLQGSIISVASPLIGKFNLYNILAAAGAAAILKVPPAVIKEGIESLCCVPGRLEKVDTTSGSYVFVDYAHKADALAQVMQNLIQIKQKRIITVFGCGGNRDRGKRPLMGDTATRYSDFTIITSDNPRLEEPLTIIDEIEAGIDKEKIRKVTAVSQQLDNNVHCYTIIPDRKKAIETAIALARTGDIVLIAGKGHEDYQIVGTKKTPFDDRIVAAYALKMKG